MNHAQNVGMDLEPAREIVRALGTPGRGDIIPLLQKIQDAYGYVPKPVVEVVSAETGIPASWFFGVATFYAQFRLVPGGRHTIRLCRGTACHVKGATMVQSALETHLAVKDGGTTEDLRFTFETVACLGTCFLAPVMMVDDDYYGDLTPAKAPKVLKSYE